MRVVCGWCHHPTPAGSCEYCGHNPALPWVQRGLAVPAADHDPTSGRPALDPADVGHRLAEARASLGSRQPTIEALADVLDVSPRTVRRWQKVAG